MSTRSLLDPFPFDRTFPLLLTAPACLATEAVVGGAALEQLLTPPVAAFGQSVWVDVFERWIFGFDLFSKAVR
ncbi:MAG: hypothetical protein KJN63_04660 [Acidimicrobiia bacterium]|nr:hypothetical protein [Acidimicrobiia bacterium]